MRRALVAATTVVGVAAFAYTVYSVGAREIHDVFLKIGWGFGAILCCLALVKPPELSPGAAPWTDPLSCPSKRHRGKACGRSAQYIAAGGICGR